MLRTAIHVAGSILAMICAALFAAAADSPAERPLLDLQHVDLARAKIIDVKPTLVNTAGTACLRLAVGHKNAWPGITFLAPQGNWDLTAFGYVAVDVHNAGTTALQAGCRLDSPGAGGKPCHFDANVSLQPGETRTIKVSLSRAMPPELEGKLFGMRGYPGGVCEYGKTEISLDAAHVTKLQIFVAKPTADHLLEASNIRTGGTPPLPLPTDLARLFPLIDSYGQYRHGDWPGKTHSDDDFPRQRHEEAADLAQHPGPADWDQYGGFHAGPKLEATGYFRTEKYHGKWWLVDPEGRLFWSHGIDCVRAPAITPITDRRHWFADLPSAGSSLAKFYGTGNWAPHGYYQGKHYETYCFDEANLLRKYGDDWRNESAAAAHRRLRSWGLNTMGNWSDPTVYGLDKTPYVVGVGGAAKDLAGSAGYWKKFADVFDPSFREGIRQYMRREKRSAGDPWCLGYFSGNELSWGDETSLALATLISPADQAAKRVFVEDLRKKYGTIARLNEAWAVQHASWESLLECREPPNKSKAHADLTAFYSKFAECYFQTCRDAIREAAPHQLYLGCRFAWVNDLAARAAAKYCDVVSYNRYQESVQDLRLPQDIDRPLLIGEFHFGALDRGMFHPGLRLVENQAARADAYRRYVRSALANPQIVGTHWFQFGDEATTGRGDGENYQIGFVDVCDRPYVETIQASRDVAAELYAPRLGK
jgi:hypothetical protein